MFEERSGHSSDLPSTGTSGGCAHPGGLPGLLSHGHIEASAHGACSRTHAPSGAGETCCHSNAGCVFPDYRWPPSGHAAVHRAESGAGAFTPSTEPRPAAATASAHHRSCLVRSLSSTQNVVETFEAPLLKTKGTSASDLLNCEGWANGNLSIDGPNRARSHSGDGLDNSATVGSRGIVCGPRPEPCPD